MTNEPEKQFFDAFGIEPREYCERIYQDGCFKNCPLYPVRKTDECFKHIEAYPEITDHILLELICILADLYDSNSRDYPLSSKDIKQLKEENTQDTLVVISRLTNKNFEESVSLAFFTAASIISRPP